MKINYSKFGELMVDIIFKKIGVKDTNNISNDNIKELADKALTNSQIDKDEYELIEAYFSGGANMDAEEKVEGIITTSLLSGDIDKFITDIKQIGLTEDDFISMELFGDRQIGILVSKAVSGNASDIKDLQDYIKSISVRFSEDNSVAEVSAIDEKVNNLTTIVEELANSVKTVITKDLTTDNLDTFTEPIQFSNVKTATDYINQITEGIPNKKDVFLLVNAMKSGVQNNIDYFADKLNSSVKDMANFQTALATAYNIENFSVNLNSRASDEEFEAHIKKQLGKLKSQNPKLIKNTEIKKGDWIYIPMDERDDEYDEVLEVIKIEKLRGDLVDLRVSVHSTNSKLRLSILKSRGASTLSITLPPGLSCYKINELEGGDPGPCKYLILKSSKDKSSNFSEENFSADSNFKVGDTFWTTWDGAQLVRIAEIDKDDAWVYIVDSDTGKNITFDPYRIPLTTLADLYSPTPYKGKDKYVTKDIKFSRNARSDWDRYDPKNFVDIEISEDAAMDIIEAIGLTDIDGTGTYPCPSSNKAGGFEVSKQRGNTYHLKGYITQFVGEILKRNNVNFSSESNPSIKIQYRKDKRDEVIKFLEDSNISWSDLSDKFMKITSLDDESAESKISGMPLITHVADNFSANSNFSEKRTISSSFEALEYVQRHIEEVHHLLFVITNHFEVLQHAYNAKDPYPSIVNQINKDFPEILKAARQAGYSIPDLKGKFPSREDLQGIIK